MTTPERASFDPPADRAEALRRLRALGGRLTASRRELVDHFFEFTESFTAEEIAQRFPKLDAATVYRALSSLERAGIVEHGHLGHGAATYRRAGTGTVPVVCELCGATIMLEGAELAALRDRVEELHGFSVELHHFALTGRCRACRNLPARSPRL
jgi:Fur family ferric uptake transcriptional regulator